ncbi:MAG: hypothetical protein ACREL6_12675 [Gemmatimonadales bacterium]
MADPVQSRKSTAAERQALINEIQTAEKEKRELHAEQILGNSREQRGLRIGLAVVLGAFLAWLWVAPPTWLNPPVASPPSPAVQEAGTRYALYLQAQQVERFRREHGRLPATLEEAGEPIRGVEYEVDGDGAWVMLAGPAGAELRLTSADTLDAFLGNSVSLLRPVENVR